MKLVYWTNFSKRKNSTKQPTGGTEIDVVLKDNTSLLNPTFQAGSVPANVNYCYVADFGRYYYVSGVSHDGPFCLIDCECDVLATYKSQIGATSAMVEFTSSSSEVRITDPRNKPLHTFEEASDKLLDLAQYGFSASNGSFVLGIAGGTGGVTYYVMSEQALSDFYDEVYDRANFINNIENQWYGIRDAVVSCKWIPYSPAGSDVQIKIGDKWLTTHGWKITDRLSTIPEASYNITFYSDSLGLGTNYLDFEPFSTGCLYLPFVGSVPLDLGVVAKSKQIRIAIALDNYTGDIVYKIANADGDFISSYQGNCSVNIPISSTQNNALGAASGAISVIGGIASTIAAVATKNPGLAAGAGLGTAGSAIGLAQSLAIHTQVNGSVSSAVAAELGLKLKYTILTRVPTFTNLTDPQASGGMPYFKIATISSLSGYVQCSNASVEIPGYIEEKDTVNGYVNGGFYYE